MTLLEQIFAHKDAVLASAARNGVCDVRIFGSVARGEERPDSDVDVLINYDGVSDPLGFVDFQEDLEKLLHRKIDIVFEKGLYHRIRPEILREAKAL